MLIQIYTKNEPLVKCDLLIARDDAVMSVPVTELKSLKETEMDIRLVKPFENMGMKAAVFIADAIANAGAVSSPVFIACSDKIILDGVCSMEYAGPAGGPIKCMASGTKPQPQPKVRNRAKAGKQAPQPGPEKQPGKQPDTPSGAPAPEGAKPADENDMGALMRDPGLVKDGEAVLTEQPGEPVKAPDPVAVNTPKIMNILKDTGIPSGQIPGVLEALREAMDAQITLPMQVKLKLAKDGATADMDPDETSSRVAPKFDELKSLLREIDDANAAKS